MEESIIEITFIGVVVANFLLNTNRGHKSIELCKECLNLLKSNAQRKDQLIKLIYRNIYTTLYNAYFLISDHTNAEKYGRKILLIYQDSGDTIREGKLWLTLARIYQKQSNFREAKELYERTIKIMIQTGDRKGEADACVDIGTMCYMLRKYTESKEYIERALAIRVEIGDREGEARDYGNLGNVILSLYEYEKAEEYLAKALAIRKEIGDRKGEAADYENLGTVFYSLGEYVKAKEYFEKALAIRIEIGDRAGEAVDYGNLGILFNSIGDSVNDKVYQEKALLIQIEIGDKNGEASSYGNLGIMFCSFGEYFKAKDYFQKALVIKREIGDRKGEAENCINLGYLSRSLGQYKVAVEYLEKALLLSKETRVLKTEFDSLYGLTLSKLSQGKIQEAFVHLYQCIHVFEDLRNFLGQNDQDKISFLEVHGVFPYETFSRLLCATGSHRDALYVEELGRARGLSDLMAAKYSVETNISANPQSWFGIEDVMRKESNCACLYISYYNYEVHVWIMKTSGAIHFKRTTVGEEILGADGNLSHFFAKHFRSLGILPEGKCEDRSLLNIVKPQRNSDEIESLTDLRLVEEDDEEVIDLKSSLSLCYKSIIAPVANFLEEPEVIIVPHRSLYKVPFAALSEKEGKYLSETHRIRIVPSLTTLKLIQDSPADYHSQTGALIVGDPNVGWVMYKGRREYVTSLPCARNEAEMVGRLVTVTPLLGDQATKQAVLEKITSVSLIHFAAHGDAERGEIALSPIRTPNSSDVTPQEQDYLLTMADISKVKVRAKLVVLSCCHSARGQIRVEGVIGIARAFLGSGARSVLVALWAIEDTATEQLMSRFYEHLAGGESASESLHQAMKWMRNNGFTKVSQWAPFMLIGDNVTFDFSK